MKIKQVLSRILFMGTLLLFNQIEPCFAAFSLSVDPYEGGYDLRFGKLDAQDQRAVKEVTIRITTNIGKQYRVYQRVEKPLSTPDGVEIDRDNFKMYTLINSNTRGTLERIEEFPVMSSDTVVYTSDVAGEADSFRLVYTLQPSPGQVAGSYNGRIVFILIPIDSAQEQVTDTLNMYADLTNEGAVELTTNTGFKTIRISSSDLDKSASEYPAVLLSVKGNLGARYRIYQQLGEAVVRNNRGENFDLSQVAYKIIESGATAKTGDMTELKSRMLVYTSDETGTGEDIAIRFEPKKDFPQQGVGVYTGVINYYLELDQTRTTVEPGLIDSVNVEFDIEPIFKIVASSLAEDSKPIEEGAVNLQFGNLNYKAGAKESKVRIRIESNLNKPYLVTQKVLTPLQNEQGDKLPNEFFTFVLEKTDDIAGELKFDGETVITPDKDMALFVSDTDGNGDEFEIIYKLSVTADTQGGDYSTGISYSLSEL
jgi:hypothetical protein